ncbi:MAG TPA: Fe-S cluster assembly protein SufD [Actinopolymorphaceae bacterium]
MAEHNPTTPTKGPGAGGTVPGAKAHSHGAGAESAADKPASHLHPVGSVDLADHPVPTGREEIWRFTPLKRLRGLHQEAPLGSGDQHTVEAQADPALKTETASADVKGVSGYLPSDRVSARAWHASERVFRVTVPKDTVVETASVFTHRGNGADQAAAGHVLIEAEPFSQAKIVLQHEGSAVLADNVEIVVGDGAHLTLVSVQDWDDDSVHHSNHHARIGRDATLRHIVMTFGGDLVRMSTSMEYAGPGGEVESLGLYFSDAGQHLEHRLFVDHNQPHTKSNVDYKGALQGEKATTVWIGDVLIRKVAENISTYEHNRNLMLTDGCRAHSVPNLEIETGEIEGAGHASATGRFDDEQLFYLQARGIPEDEARRLVVYGYFADIIRRIGVSEVEERLMAAVERELERGSGLAPASSGVSA